MEKLRFLLLPLYIISGMLFTGCSLSSQEENSDYHIIDMTGSSMVLSYLRSTYDFGSLSMDEGDTISLAVLEGDLLYLLSQDFEFVMLYRYKPDDGKMLSFSFDSTDHICYLNGEVISLVLSDESGAWNWIEQQDGESFRSIRSLSITLPLKDGGYESLERIAGINPDPGLYISGNGPANELFDLFRPEWIFAEDVSLKRVSDQAGSNLSGTELLVYSCSDSGSMEFLYDLPGLQSLALIDYGSDALIGFPLERLTGLRSLSIIESDLHDLSCIGSLTGLQTIDLVEWENLQTIEELRNFRDLKGLGIRECNNIKDIRIISELPGLERLGLPSGVSQADFEAIIAGQPSLKVLEIIYCENITDLSPLEGNSGLKVLTIGLDNVDLGPLHGMTNLELLTLEQEYFKDSLQIATLKRALPDTRIVPGGTFCLGSGWLILLIPVIIIWVGLKRWEKAGS